MRLPQQLMAMAMIMMMKMMMVTQSMSFECENWKKKEERIESDRQDELMTNKKMMDGKASDDADVREKKNGQEAHFFQFLTV